MRLQRSGRGVLHTPSMTRKDDPIMTELVRLWSGLAGIVACRAHRQRCQAGTPYSNLRYTEDSTVGPMDRPITGDDRTETRKDDETMDQLTLGTRHRLSRRAALQHTAAAGALVIGTLGAGARGLTGVAEAAATP